MKKLIFILLSVLICSGTVHAKKFKKLTKSEKKAFKKTQSEDKFWFAGKHTLKVIQNRYYKKEGRVELNFISAGYFLKNQYIDIYSFGGSMSYFFNEIWGWEFINTWYAKSRERAEVQTLKTYSKKITGTTITADIRKPTHFFTSNIIYTPLYGKFSILEAQFIYMDMYLALGGGVVKVNNIMKPTVNWGLGMKFFMSKHFLTRVDLRQYFYQDTIYGQEGLRDKIVLSAGFSYVF
jgi:outer membrane beta-barrel protein